MDGIRTKTLTTLPNQPLPSQTKLAGPVFVTIWLFITALFTFIIWRALTKPKPASQEFKTILYGTGFLTLWYFIIVVDRWIHYDSRAVGYGYILLIPIWEFFYVGSTIFILWGTYTIVWKELRDRFSGLTRTHQIAWWFVGNFALFILCMVSLFYVILFIALASIWLKFSSLNAIDDVATKRNGFEIAMHAFFFVFSLITSGAAAVAFWGAREVDGKTGQTRTTLLVATFLLLGRSLSQFAIALRANRPDVTRQDTQLARDISYGLLTVLYLAVISYFAFSTTNEYNREGRDAQAIQSDIRKHILTKLHNDTREGRHMSPDFETLYQDTGMNLEKILDSGPLSTTSSLDRDHKRRVAQEYLEQLKADYGELNPKEGRDMSVVDSRPGSVASVFSRKVTPSGRKVTPSGRRTASNPNLRRSEARNSPTPSHNLRKKSQEMLARFSPRVHDTVEEEERI